MNVLIRCILTLSLLLDSAASGAMPLRLDESLEALSIGGSVQVLEDPERRLALTDILRPEHQAGFSPNHQAIPNYGFTPSAYWFKLDVMNTTDATAEWYLEVEDTMLNHVGFHVVRSNGETLSKTAGSLLPWFARDVNTDTFVFRFTLAAGESATLYLDIWNDAALMAPLQLWLPHAYHAHDRHRSMAYSVYFGIMLAMFIYNTFVNVRLGEPTYLFYLMFLAASAFNFACMNGVAGEFILQESPRALFLAFCVSYCLMGATGTLFAYRFIGIGSRQRFAKPGLQVIVFFWLAITAGILMGDTQKALQSIATVTLLMLAYCIALGVIGVRTGSHEARYYLGGWCLFLLGMLMTSLTFTGVIDRNLITYYCMQFGSACEALLLSLALAARLRTLQQERDAAHKHLVQQEKMANLGLLTAGISHEIKNPAQFLTLGAANVESRLQELQAFTADLTADDPDAELNAAFNTRFDGLYQQLRVVKEGSDRIQAIIQGMRHASRRDESGTKAAFDPVQGLLSTVELVKPTWKTTIDFDTNGLTTGTPVTGFASAMNQVFTNLMVNACQAMEERQKTAPSGYRGRLTLASSTSEDGLAITIEDNGCGMDDDTRRRLFEPFFTTKDKDRGTGLGMGICRGILDDHGGRLEVDSAPGKGTRMTIVLPAVSSGTD
jgi:signal transduction histidine kinase